MFSFLRSLVLDQERMWLVGDFHCLLSMVWVSVIASTLLVASDLLKRVASLPATTTTITTTTTTTTILQLSGLCPGQPGSAGARRNIHPLTSIMVIRHPLSASSIFYNPWHPHCSIYVPDSLFTQSLSKFSLVYLLSWHPHCILHTFLYSIIVFFLQHMPIPSQPVLL